MHWTIQVQFLVVTIKPMDSMDVLIFHHLHLISLLNVFGTAIGTALFGITKNDRQYEEICFGYAMNISQMENNTSGT